MKKFIHVNEGFRCDVCGEENPPASCTCRNHCRKCLHSKHVDRNPGDRAESCADIMDPVDIELHRGEMESILFCCRKCGIVRRNKIASDDDREKLFQTIEKKSKM